MLHVANWLSRFELEAHLIIANHIAYTTVRGAFRMAPQRGPFTHTVDLFLEGSEPYGAYIARYGVGAEREPHTDAGMPHERVICCLREAEEGGVLFVGTLPVVLRPGDAVFFRADRQEHSVSRVLRGERIVLTVGRPIHDAAPRTPGA